MALFRLHQLQQRPGCLLECEQRDVPLIHAAVAVVVLLLVVVVVAVVVVVVGVVVVVVVVGRNGMFEDLFLLLL